MKSSTKDKIKGLTDKIKGNVKEGLGSLSGNRDLEEDGKNDQFEGCGAEKDWRNKEGLQPIASLQQNLKYNLLPDSFFGLPDVSKGAAGSSAHFINLIHETRKRGCP